MTNQMPELKACPFCGGKAKIYRNGTMRQSMIIGCDYYECKLETGEAKGVTKPENYAWNTRTGLVTTRAFHPSQASDEQIDEVAMAEYGEPVIDDELREAVEILRDCKILITRNTKWSDAKINYAIETLITHAMKGEGK